MAVIRERMNLYLPKRVADELCRRKLKAALKASAGAWKAEDHPELATFEDVNRWIEEGRKVTRDFSNEWGEDA